MIEAIHSARTTSILFGDIDMTGALSADSYIEVSHNSDLTATSKDAGGRNSSISLLTDYSGTVSIQLQPQSSANQALAEVVRRDRARGGLTIRDIAVVTEGTVHLFEFIGCHIMQLPSDTKGRDLSTTTNTWVFYCDEIRPKKIQNSVFSVEVQGSIEERVDATISIQL